MIRRRRSERLTLASFEQGHSVAVGVGIYQDAAWKVPLTKADATEYTNALANPVVSSYPGGKVSFYTTRRPTGRH